MGVEPRTITYVPGQNRAFDDLVKALDRLEKVPALEAEPTKERPVEDPFGLKGAESESDGGPTKEVKQRSAHSMAEKMVKLAAILLMENGVKDAYYQMFAYELFGLIVMNSKDCPLNPVELNRARREAFEYFEAHK